VLAAAEGAAVVVAGVAASPGEACDGGPPGAGVEPRLLWRWGGSLYRAWVPKKLEL
jgi:hypothetical protein